MSLEQFMSTTNNYDKICADKIDESLNLLVPWYLMAAYAYYVEDNPILSDSFYDRLVQKLLANWDSIEHPHKELLSKEQLEAGTYLGEYPSRIKGALESLREIK